MLNDIALIKRAAKERWPIKAELKTKVLERLEKVVHHEDPEIGLRAIQAIAKLDSLNIAQEKIYAPRITATVDLNKLSDNELEKQIAELEAELAAEKALPKRTVVDVDTRLLDNEIRIENPLFSKPRSKREL